MWSTFDYRCTFLGFKILSHYSLPLWDWKSQGRFIIELRLYSSERRKSYTRWLEDELIMRSFSFFGELIPLSNSTFFRICLKKHLKGIVNPGSEVYWLNCCFSRQPVSASIRAGFRSGGLGVGVYSSMGTISWRGSDVETREHDGRNSARRPPSKLPLTDFLYQIHCVCKRSRSKNKMNFLLWTTEAEAEIDGSSKLRRTLFTSVKSGCFGIQNLHLIYSSQCFLCL